MERKHLYYLHENGDLIHKRELDGSIAAGIRESPFARGLWFIDQNNREHAWNVLVEALAGGAKASRIQELAEFWGCNDSDAPNYAQRLGFLLGKDGSAWCATRGDFINLQESPAGFGNTALEAMAALAKELGYKPSKMWGNTFGSLLTAGRDETDIENGQFGVGA